MQNALHKLYHKGGTDVNTEKQLHTAYDIQKMIYNLENLDDDIHLQLENSIDEAVSFYEKVNHEQNIDHIDYEKEIHRFNYENLERRHKDAGRYFYKNYRPNSC